MAHLPTADAVRGGGNRSSARSLVLALDLGGPRLEALIPTDATGGAGSTVTVSGSGCPTGTTASVFARIEGASDDPVPAFDQTNPGTELELATGGSFSGRFTVSADSPEGENRIWVYCVSEGGEPMAGPIRGVFVVDNSLPPTGSTVAPLVVAGIIAVAVRHVGDG